MKTTKNNITEEGIANSMGGNFANAQIGDAGNLAGVPGLLGCPAPAINMSCWEKRKQRNKKDEDRISKLVSILLKKTMPTPMLQEAAASSTRIGSISKPGTKDAAIAGISDKLAQNLPPGKVVTPTNKPAKGVNGLELNNANLANVATTLSSAIGKYPQAKLNINDILRDSRSIYTNKNAIESAERSDYNTAFERNLFFFQKGEDSDDTGETINNKRQQSLSNYFDKKTHRRN